MGKNKLQKFADMSRYPNVFQRTFADLQKGAFEMRGRWNEVFFKNDHPIVLELGCGRGEYTVELAKRFPERNFIGVDIKGARMWAGAKQALADELPNVAFLRSNIELINRFFAPGEVSEIWLTFPDPQMKKASKRLTGTRFMQLYSEILGENGQIHLKTDSPFLYTYTLAMVEANGLPVLQKIEDVQGTQPGDVLSIQTYYEQQWRDRGMTIKYLQFTLTPKPEYVEPEVKIEPDSYRSFNRSRRSAPARRGILPFPLPFPPRSRHRIMQTAVQVSCFITLILVIFLLWKSSRKTPEPVFHHLPTVTTTVISAPTVSFPVPSEVEFAGERISLERFDMRERYDRELNVQAYLHATTMLLIKRANRYFPVIEPILKANNIPDDFKYLCVIESNLDTRALSPAKAAGLWQFMPATAKDFGLEVRDGVDERYHTEKATEAACKYLRAAYQRYHSWVDVAAAYNAGMGRISSEMGKQAAESAFDLLLVSETSRYVFRILAAKEILSHPQQYGYALKRENLYPPIAVDYVDVTGNVPDLAVFAKKYGISYATLKEFNVWLRDAQLMQPPRTAKNYRIAIPKKEDLLFDGAKIKVHNEEWVTD